MYCLKPLFSCQRTSLLTVSSDQQTPPRFTHQRSLATGGGERVRTDDLLRARQALSQLSYTPTVAYQTCRPSHRSTWTGGPRKS